MKLNAKDMNLRERFAFVLDPQKGLDRYAKRKNREEKEANQKMSATGYGNHGASHTLTSMVGWLAGGGSAEDDIDLQGDTLRKRARDLFAGGGLARSGPVTLQTSVVAWGIKPKPKIDNDLLGISDEAAAEWEQKALREFSLWADDVWCDAERQKDFYAMQQLAFLSMLVSGDVFALFGSKANMRTPYMLTIRLLEADRVCTPDSSGESASKESENGNGRIIDGVEVDRDGSVIRYYIANRHPLSGEDGTELKWAPIDAFGKDTGYPNILHIFQQERPEQRRGVPFVAAEIEQLKQLTRYLNSELAANVVAAMYTAFITSEEDDGTSAVQDAVSKEEKVTDDEGTVELAPGAIIELSPGKKLQEANPMRQNSAFESFVSTLITISASGMNIPREVLVKQYESNYTAARAALLDFWRTVKVYRTRFNSLFNKPIYEMWLAEAVATGRIEAPGFFDDPAVRKAWCGCQWMGASMGHVDPLKEINAAAARIQNNITTQEQEAMEYNGNDWHANIRQRKKELTEMQELQALVSALEQDANGNNAHDPDDDEEDDDDA